MLKKRKKCNEEKELLLLEQSNQITQQLQIEKVSADGILREGIVPVKGEELISKINFVVAESFKSANSVKNAVFAAKLNQGDLYRVIIPKGQHLAISRDAIGANRASYHEKGKIAGNANLVKYEQGGLIVGNAVNAAMNIASVVVGQYYMSQVDDNLKSIEKSISQIADFNDKQYKSKVFALLTKVKTLSCFQSEILDSKLQLNASLNTLNNLEQQCIELLGQANLMIADFSQKTDIDFAEYEKELYNSQNWYSYQKVLLDILYSIADLKFALYLGEASREQCNALLHVYTKQCKDACLKLSEWHKSTIKRLKINISDLRRRRDGIDGIIHRVAGLFDDDYNFKTISAETAQLISNQILNGTDISMPADNLYGEDLVLFLQDGKVYYLPNKQEV